MHRAPRIVAAAFALSVAVLVLLVGPLLLFNPFFVSALQARHAVPATLDATQAEIDETTRAILADLFTGGDFSVTLAGEPLLDETERAHMGDVSWLVRLLVVAAAVAAVVAALCGTLLRGEPQRMASVLLATASVLGVAAVALGLVFAVAFEPAFLAFHAIFFPPGTYLFEPGSSLIALFPAPFWFEASLMAGLTVLLSALVVGGIGLLGRRGPPATSAAA